MVRVVSICMRLIWHLVFALGYQKATSLVAQMVKNLPAMQETWVGKIPWSPGVAAHSWNILAWRIPWKGAWRAIVHGVAKSQTQ